MKKNIYLLITFMVSLFIFCGRVDAAKELVCIYDREKSGIDAKYTTMFIQNKEGKFYYYVMKADAKNIADINRTGWVYYTEVSNKNLGFYFETDYYDSNSKILTACPKYSSVFKKNSKDVTFYDDKNNVLELSEKLSCENCLPYIMGGGSVHEDEISNIRKASWSSKCSYCSGDNKNCIDLYFNETELFVDNHRDKTNSEELDFGIKEIKESYGYVCPPTIYEAYDSFYTTLVAESTHFKANYYLINPKSSLVKYNFPVCTSTSDSVGMFLSCTVHYLYELKLNKKNSVDTKSYDGKPGSIFDGENIDNCKDLIDEDIRKIINDILNYIKILVPILLVGFGIFDFTKAVFSNSDGDMSKHKKKFFMRIVAAVIVFLVPTLVNLLLTLANEVWAYISPTSCL